MGTAIAPPSRQVRAHYDDHTITVYQAFSPAIADAALAAGTFVQPFKLDRMTWIKPSFLWMMYRCGWATKPGAERVLAVSMTWAGFEHALSQACLSHYDPDVHPDHDTWQRLKTESPVRVQWDPERAATLEPLPWRTIQVGISGQTVHDYVHHWVTKISDVTPLAHRLRTRPHERTSALPVERAYPIPDAVGRRIGTQAPS